jgi:hypothetical protein
MSSLQMAIMPKHIRANRKNIQVVELCIRWCKLSFNTKIWGSMIVSDDDTTQVPQCGKSPNCKRYKTLCSILLNRTVVVEFCASMYHYIDRKKDVSNTPHMALVCAYNRIRITDILLGSMTHKKWPVATVSVADLGRGQTTPLLPPN